jgi:ribonuclease T2
MRHLLAAACLVLCGTTADAFQRLDGTFRADKACEAVQSLDTRANPGDVRTRAGGAYRLLGRNAPGGPSYLIRFPEASGAMDRWVATGCGSVVTGGAQPGNPTMPPAPRQSLVSTDNVLALSWQPAFCEARPDTEECGALNGGRLPLAETQLSIHGLWPQPRSREYCGVSARLVGIDDAARWEDLPPPEMDADTRSALAEAMPGTASGLERHEWLRHGTCYRTTGGADAYFDDMLWLAARINESAVGTFLRDNVGEEIRIADLRRAFDEAFGERAGDHVAFSCLRDGPRTLLQEMRIHLRGTISTEASLPALILAAPPVRAGCIRAMIDAAGLQ